VEITKVECVLFHLSAVFRREDVDANFALNNDNQASSKDDDINTPAQPVKRKFEEDGPVVCFGANLQDLDESVLQLRDGTSPRYCLTGVLRCETISCVRLLKRTDDRSYIRMNESTNGESGICWHR
jgi:hypothetical protein